MPQALNRERPVDIYVYQNMWCRIMMVPEVTLGADPWLVLSVSSPSIITPSVYYGVVGIVGEVLTLLPFVFLSWPICYPCLLGGIVVGIDLATPVVPNRGVNTVVLICTVCSCCGICIVYYFSAFTYQEGLETVRVVPLSLDIATSKYPYIYIYECIYIAIV